MKEGSYHRTMFLIAGLWNIVAGLASWLGGVFMPNFFFLFGTKRPESLFFFTATFGLIVAYGIGYLFVSRDVTKNRAIVITGGLVGKIIFFIDCVFAVAIGQANALLLFPGIADLVFAGLFVEFLVSTMRQA